MMQFAESCKSVMDKVVELFQGAAGKLSTLWRALLHDKDDAVKLIKSLSVGTMVLCQ